MTRDTQNAAGSGAAIGSVGYEYDLGGRLFQMAPTSAVVDSYLYDPGNRLVAISRSNGSASCFTYDQADRRTAFVYPNSMTASPLWDSLSDETQLAYTYHGSYTPGGSGGLGTCTPGTQTGNGTGTLDLRLRPGRAAGRPQRLLLHPAAAHALRRGHGGL